MDLVTARAILAQQCASSIYPTLDDGILAFILQNTVGWTIWLPNTTYNHGDKVIPTVRNGHVYQALVNQQYSATPAGVSDVTEPIWPLFSSPDSRTGITRPYWAGYDQQSGNYSLSMVTDGTIVWQDAGPDNDAPWNLRLATYNAWMMKAALAGADYDIAPAQGMQFKRDQVMQHCLTMACRYAPTGIA